MPRPDVMVIIFHPEPGADAGALTRAVGIARAGLADAHRRGFLAVGATDVRIVAGPPDGTAFGERLRAAMAGRRAGGIVVLGSGAIPLATKADRRAFVEAAAGQAPGALANNRYSADVIAIAQAEDALRDLPDLISDNGLPRLLGEQRGIPVDDLRRRWRLGIDIDSPLDLVLLGDRWASPLPPGARQRVDDRRDRLRALADDASAELVVSGRTSARTLSWLETRTAGRVRAIVEERGMRTSRPGQRPAASILGALLDRDGPGTLGEILGRLGDGAMVDTRVLLGHRLGADETGWPSPEDRYASDLLAHEGIRDPWLRDVTRSAADAPMPVLLGGHTLVGPGARLVLGRGT